MTITAIAFNSTMALFPITQTNHTLYTSTGISTAPAIISFNVSIVLSSTPLYLGKKTAFWPSINDWYFFNPDDAL